MLFCLLCTCQTQSESTSPEYGAVSISNKNNTAKPAIGKVIDKLNGIPIYYNGKVRHTNGRHLSTDGYNYGLRWQCVEFVKRYYYDHLDHKMPNPWGHAKQFFNLNLVEGEFNPERNLYQFRNGSKRKPQVDDIVVFGGQSFGHVAIVAAVEDDYIELAQQNVGTESRVKLPMTLRKDRWVIRDAGVLGLLGKKK